MYGIGLFVLFALNSARGDNLLDARTALAHDLLQNYNADIIPSGLDGGPLVVEHSLWIENIDSLVDGVLTLHGYQRFSWHDSRLKWDPAEHAGIKHANHIPVKKLWKPDIILYNSANEYTGFHYDDVYAYVYSDGTVSFDPPLYSKSVCPFDESDLYTNNTVVCGLEFMSWSHSGQQLDINLIFKHAEVSSSVSNYIRKWKLVGSTAERTVIVYPCCPDIPYIKVQYDLIMQRIA